MYSETRIFGAISDAKNLSDSVNPNQQVVYMPHRVSFRPQPVLTPTVWHAFCLSIYGRTWHGLCIACENICLCYKYAAARSKLSHIRGADILSRNARRTPMRPSLVSAIICTSSIMGCNPGTVCDGRGGTKRGRLPAYSDQRRLDVLLAERWASLHNTSCRLMELLRFW